VQSGDLHVVMASAAQGGHALSPTVPVVAGPFDWATCGVKIIDDRIQLGQEGGLVIVPKDRFGNALAADASVFSVVVVTETAVGVADEMAVAAGAITATARAVTAHFTPKVRGRLRCVVAYLGAAGSGTDATRASNVVVVD
jgi:hypothetical protein